MNNLPNLTVAASIKSAKLSSLLIILLLVIGNSGICQTIKGTYAIKNVQNGMLLRMQDANKKDGTALVAYSPVNWKCVTWDFTKIEGNSYQLRNLFTNKTFQPENMKPVNGTVLHQQPISLNQNNQLYEFILIEKDIYLIKLKNTELYLSPADPKGTVNSAIVVNEKKKGKEQWWTIYEQHPTM